MKLQLLPVCFLLFCGSLFAQTYLDVPVSLPVFLDKTADQPETFVADLTGIAMMMVYPSEQVEQMTVNKDGNSIIRQEQSGSTNLTTIALSENGVPVKLEFSNTGYVSFVSLWYDADKLAEGRLLFQDGKYQIRLNGQSGSTALAAVKKVVEAANRHLMSMHWQEHRTIPIQNHFISDTLNVIVGTDTQFGASNDLYWFDKTLYQELRSMAKKTFGGMVEQKKNLLTRAYGATGDIRLEVTRVPHHLPTVHGSLKAHFKLAPDASLYFLRLGAEYEIELGYTVQRFPGERETFKLNKISLKHLDTNDFVEMNILDLSNAGYNLLYVDLINAVVMEDQGVWDMQQVLEVIQDSFREMSFENTYSIGASD